MRCTYLTVLPAIFLDQGHTDCGNCHPWSQKEFSSRRIGSEEGGGEDQNFCFVTWLVPTFPIPTPRRFAGYGNLSEIAERSTVRDFTCSGDADEGDSYTIYSPVRSIIALSYETRALL